jgi:hypothetical protein
VLLRWHQSKKGEGPPLLLGGEEDSGARQASQGDYTVDELGSHGSGNGLEDDLEKLGIGFSWFDIFVGKR